MPKTIHIVAGPTASGKSAYAVGLAQKLDGVIINCDSMQIYDGLPILSAQPSEEDKRTVPHELYGVLHPNEDCSAGIWREMAVPVIERILQKNKTSIVVGGTGLYIKVLIEGLSPIPDIPKHIRDATIQKQIELGNPGFYNELEKRDPVTAARFHPQHTARLIRAWEVLEATGRTLTDWQKEDKQGAPADWHFEIHKIMPDREILHERCNARFDTMLQSGAWNEVKEFDELLKSGKVKETSLLTKALGFRPLQACLHGKMTKEDAIERSQADTRQYAKRQVTWFKNQL